MSAYATSKWTVSLKGGLEKKVVLYQLTSSQQGLLQAGTGLRCTRKTLIGAGRRVQILSARSFKFLHLVICSPRRVLCAQQGS